MLIKVTGKIDGDYTEETYEDVIKYRVSQYSENKNMDDGTVFDGGNTDFLRLTLFYSKDEFEYVYFNTVCYVMSSDGKTIDVLRYDTRKDKG